jgi:hypothetical protein
VLVVLVVEGIHQCFCCTAYEMDCTTVTKFLDRWGRGTGSWYVVRYLREIFTLRVENEPVNPGRGRRTWVEDRR